MSERSPAEDELVRFAALLDEFSAAQRRSALGEAKKQKITIVRTIGQVCQVNYETVIDEGVSSDEIYRLLAPIDGAIDRLKAKSDLSDHYNLALNQCASLEHQAKKLASDRRGFEIENARRSENRRQQIGLTSQQVAGLNETRTQINKLFADIDEKLAAAEECKRVLDGTNPMELLREQVTRRLDALRGNRDEAA